MRYLFETFYNEKFELKKLVVLVAEYCAQFSDSYYADIIFPKKDIIGEPKRTELLAKGDVMYISDTVDWIMSNTSVPDAFHLHLLGNDEAIDKSDSLVFEYNDNTNNWSLNLSHKQFKGLIEVLVQNEYPENLFYDTKKAVITKSKGILGLIGATTVYSPKQFEALQEKK